jgi:fatty acid-binding protein DegV
MKIKIVSDSSCNIINLEGISFESVPLTIVTENKEYVDDSNLDVNQMVKDLRE